MDGALDWQNGLNAANAPFFDACDGLFTNYTWQTAQPLASAAHAASPARRRAIYTGIDVFGRGTYGGGGFAVHAVRPTTSTIVFTGTPTAHPHARYLCVPRKALDVILEARTSVALFAPAWTWEVASGKGATPPRPLSDRLWWDGPCTR